MKDTEKNQVNEYKANLLNPLSPDLKEPEIQVLCTEITRLIEWIITEAHLRDEDVDKFNLMNQSFVHHFQHGDKKKALYEARKAKEFLINKYCVVDGEMISLRMGVKWSVSEFVYVELVPVNAVYHRFIIPPRPWRVTGTL